MYSSRNVAEYAPGGTHVLQLSAFIRRLGKPSAVVLLLFIIIVPLARVANPNT